MVYAVSSGSYSDYSIHAIFATEAAAQAVCDIAGYEIEPFELLDSAERLVEYTIKVDRTPGGVWAEPTSVLEGGFYLWESERLVWEWDSYTHKNGRPKVNRWRNGGMIVSGRNLESVRKAVYDTIALVKAEEAQIIDPRVVTDPGDGPLGVGFVRRKS